METVMVSREDLESFLIRMDLNYEEVDEGMFLTRGDDGGLPVVVHHADALLLIRMKVMDMPEESLVTKALYRTLLELNATEIVHGAYGIEEGDLILSDTLELETLDFHERPWSRLRLPGQLTWSKSGRSRATGRRANKWASSQSFRRSSSQTSMISFLGLRIPRRC
jgi:hypothetical protein